MGVFVCVQKQNKEQCRNLAVRKRAHTIPKTHTATASLYILIMSICLDMSVYVSTCLYMSLICVCVRVDVCVRVRGRVFVCVLVCARACVCMYVCVQSLCVSWVVRGGVS